MCGGWISRWIPVGSFDWSIPSELLGVCGYNIVFIITSSLPPGPRSVLLVDTTQAASILKTVSMISFSLSCLLYSILTILFAVFHSHYLVSMIPFSLFCSIIFRTSIEQLQFVTQSLTYRACGRRPIFLTGVPVRVD